jgi:hypothetical protein
VSELELLFLVLAVIYGWECACWLRRGSVAFRTWFGRRWRPVHPGALLGNQRGGFIFAQPLPPLGTLLTGNQFPLSLSPEAVLAYVAPTVNPGWRPAQTEALFRFDDIRKVEARGKQVRVNGELLLRAPSPMFAAQIAEQLRQLLKLAPAARESAIEAMVRDAFDCKAIERRWQDFQKQTGKLRLLTNGLFGYLFILTPILIWQLGLRLCWLGLLAGLLAFTIAAAVSFHRSHKTFYPAAEDERFTHFLIILLSPATTIRAYDVLSRPLLEAFHPLAIAKVFCPEPAFREFARRVLREIRHPALPVCPRAEPAALAAERYARTVLEKTVEEFLRQGGVNLAELMQPPVPADESCHSYCPRCLAQFTTVEGSCADCGGLALAALAAPAERPATLRQASGGCDSKPKGRTA